MSLHFIIDTDNTEKLGNAYMIAAQHVVARGELTNLPQLDSAREPHPSQMLSALDLATTALPSEKINCSLPWLDSRTLNKTNIDEISDRQSGLISSLQDHQETYQRIQAELPPAVQKYAWWMKNSHIPFLQALTKLEDGNTERLIESFKTRSAFVPKEYEDLPKYASLNDVLKADISTGMMRIGKILVDKNDLPYFEELCRAWEKKDPMGCIEQLTCLRHAPRDVQLRFINASKPYREGATEVGLRMYWNPHVPKKIDTFYLKLQVKKNYGIADFSGNIVLDTADALAHEVQHVMGLLYAPNSMLFLARSQAGLQHTLAEAIVVQGYESSLKCIATKQLSRDYILSSPVAVASPNSLDGALAYRKTENSQEALLRLGESLLGKIQSVDDTHVVMDTPEGKITIPTDALANNRMLHSLIDHKFDADYQKNLIHSINEHRQSRQPVSIRLDSTDGHGLPKIVIKRHTIGTDTMLHSMARKQRARLSQGLVRSPQLSEGKPPTARDLILLPPIHKKTQST